MANEDTDIEERRQPEGDEEDSGRVVVNVDDDQGDDGGEEAAGARAERPQGREEKKAARRRLIEEHATATRERDELRREVAQLRGAVMQSLQQTRSDTARARNDDDPSETELTSIYEEQQTLADQVAALGTKITPEQLNSIQRKARQLDQRKMEIAAERIQRRNGNNAGVDRSTVMRQALEMQYSDVYSNGRARDWAKGEYQRLISDPRSPMEPGMDAIKQALENARREFGMGRQVTDTQRARMTGVPRGGSGGGPARKSDITMSKGQMKMADNAFSHIPLQSGKKPHEQPRYKQWAKTAGKALAEDDAS